MKENCNISKEIIASLKEEPVELFQAEEFQKLIKYAETNQANLDTYWQNNSNEEIHLFLKYATSKLAYFENFTQSDVQQCSAFKLGKLLGAIESYGKIIYEKKLDRLVVDRLYEDGRTIKYLDDIVKLLESHGGLTHAELCKYLSLKTSTLSEAIKKVLATGIVDFRCAGKYKIYSLTDDGIRYGRYIRNQKRDMVSGLIKICPRCKMETALVGANFCPFCAASFNEQNSADLHRKMQTKEIRSFVRKIEEKYKIGGTNNSLFIPNEQFMRDLQELKENIEQKTPRFLPETKLPKDEVLSGRNIHCAEVALKLLSSKEIDWFKAWCEMTDMFDYKEEDDLLCYDELTLFGIVLDVYIFAWRMRGE